MVDAEGQSALAGRIRAALSAALPIGCRADVVSIFMSDDFGNWRRERSLPFGPA
jgi:hypothetical protein